MARVTELAHELAELSDSGKARQALCTGAVRVTRAASGALWEPEAQGAALELSASTDPQPTVAVIPFTGPSHGAIEAFASGRPVTAAPDRDAPSAGVSIWQPIVRDTLTVAVLELRFADPAALDASSNAMLVDLLAIESAVTLQRVSLLSDLEARARTDELTGLPNRRAWHEQLPRQLAAAATSAAPLSLAMIDLDYFKRYNDTQGHQAGDRLLKQVSGAWTGELRPGDLLVRYGGEEFALALPHCGVEEALVIVERLRSLIPDGQSCSAGVVSWDGEESATELLGRADEALYDAKRGGRNQSVTVRNTVAR
jgi:diguanylate cyclase (GGDEF)-like protein